MGESALGTVLTGTEFVKPTRQSCCKKKGSVNKSKQMLTVAAMTTESLQPTFSRHGRV